MSTDTDTKADAASLNRRLDAIEGDYRTVAHAIEVASIAVPIVVLIVILMAIFIGIAG